MKLAPPLKVAMLSDVGPGELLRIRNHGSEFFGVVATSESNGRILVALDGEPRWGSIGLHDDLAVVSYGKNFVFCHIPTAGLRTALETHFEANGLMVLTRGCASIRVRSTREGGPMAYYDINTSTLTGQISLPRESVAVTQWEIRLTGEPPEAQPLFKFSAALAA